MVCVCDCVCVCVNMCRYGCECSYSLAISHIREQHNRQQNNNDKYNTGIKLASKKKEKQKQQQQKVTTTMKRAHAVPITIYTLIFQRAKTEKIKGKIYQQRPENNNNATIKIKLLKVQETWRWWRTKNGRARSERKIVLFFYRF